MLSVNVPLDPRKIAEIDAMVAGLNPTVAAHFRARQIAREQAEANQKAVNRRIYRKALEEARLNGHPDPEGFACDRVLDARLADVHTKRLAAIFKRVWSNNRRRANKLASKQELASKTATKNFRRLPQADRHYVDIIGEAERYGYLDDAALVMSKFPSHLKSYRLPHWEKTTISLKVMAMSMEAAKEGAQTINLRIHPSVRAKASASPRGPAGYMQEAIRRSFRATFGPDRAPEFWFVIELDGSDGDHFHLHGAVVTPSIANGFNLVDAALCSAAGGWDDPSGQIYQQVPKELTDPIYWASYAVKTMNITGREIERKRTPPSIAKSRAI